MRGGPLVVAIVCDLGDGGGMDTSVGGSTGGEAQQRGMFRVVTLALLGRTLVPVDGGVRLLEGAKSAAYSSVASTVLIRGGEPGGAGDKCQGVGHKQRLLPLLAASVQVPWPAYLGKGPPLQPLHAHFVSSAVVSTAQAPRTYSVVTVI
jgi:hypothetical protein